MPPEREVPEAAWRARRRAAQASERAEREQAAAERNERLAADTGQDFYRQAAAAHRRAAAAHRRTASCQLTTARLHEAHASSLRAWRTSRSGDRPRFMTGVARACGTTSAAVSLIGPDRARLAVAASNDRAHAAQELEYLLGEGPARDAANEVRVVAESGRALQEHWPAYGPALREMGITGVIAAPLHVPGGCIGALSVFGEGDGMAGTGLIAEVADALTRTVFLGPDADPGLYGDTDLEAVVHQAAGMVSVQLGCRIGDALELVKARAFAEGESLRTIAERIVRRELTLG
ncbi:GAF and ANTAR domain-containing protein [Streptomyces minutiscleroticus]|uniref:ANTAR domain-containing protein n=1 Tax=Streptomyces minutiscleroticus TaxID=68238 RepID=A0A918K7D4_9ACTN|nr:GAF and ANTAR domain-containing protein [Streptomyces minutiscleroticus]GGX53071.1 hypothetical protein GCM10010358_03620 [Streptomyces minutiscleroticus]